MRTRRLLALTLMVCLGLPFSLSAQDTPTPEPSTNTPEPPTATFTDLPSATPVPPTDTPLPTETSLPTATLEPSFTPTELPSPTLTPTFTLAPSETMTETWTPTPSITASAIETATATATHTATPLPPEPGLQLQFWRTFDEGGDFFADFYGERTGLVYAGLSGYTLFLNNRALAVTAQDYGDVVAQATFILTDGNARLSVRAADFQTVSGYTAAIRVDGQLTLLRDGVEVANALLPISEAYTVRLSAFGDMIRIAVNGAEVLQYVDPQPLLGGLVTLGSTIPDTGWVLSDDVQIWTEATEEMSSFAAALAPNAAAFYRDVLGSNERMLFTGNNRLYYISNNFQPEEIEIPLQAALTLFSDGAFSPDGNWVAYACQQTVGAQGICVSRPDGSDFSLALTYVPPPCTGRYCFPDETTHTFRKPVWSPSGTQLAYTHEIVTSGNDGNYYEASIELRAFDLTTGTLTGTATELSGSHLCQSTVVWFGDTIYCNSFGSLTLGGNRYTEGILAINTVTNTSQLAVQLGIRYSGNVWEHCGEMAAAPIGISNNVRFVCSRMTHQYSYPTSIIRFNLALFTLNNPTAQDWIYPTPISGTIGNQMLSPNSDRLVYTSNGVTMLSAFNLETGQRQQPQPYGAIPLFYDMSQWQTCVTTGCSVPVQPTATPIVTATPLPLPTDELEGQPCQEDYLDYLNRLPLGTAVGEREDYEWWWRVQRYNQNYRPRPTGNDAEGNSVSVQVHHTSQGLWMEEAFRLDIARSFYDQTAHLNAPGIMMPRDNHREANRLNLLTANEANEISWEQMWSEEDFQRYSPSMSREDFTSIAFQMLNAARTPRKCVELFKKRFLEFSYELICRATLEGIINDLPIQARQLKAWIEEETGLSIDAIACSQTPRITVVSNSIRERLSVRREEAYA